MRTVVALGLLAIAALAVNVPPARAQSAEDVQATIKNFEKDDPGMQAWFREAHGYAVFPSVGKGGIGIGGARGKGLVYERGYFDADWRATRISHPCMATHSSTRWLHVRGSTPRRSVETQGGRPVSGRCTDWRSRTVPHLPGTREAWDTHDGGRVWEATDGSPAPQGRCCCWSCRGES